VLAFLDYQELFGPAAILVGHFPYAVIWIPGAAVFFDLGASERADKREGGKR
jgi:hypothetical protein